MVEGIQISVVCFSWAGIGDGLVQETARAFRRLFVQAAGFVSEWRQGLAEARRGSLVASGRSWCHACPSGIGSGRGVEYPYKPETALEVKP